MRYTSETGTGQLSILTLDDGVMQRVIEDNGDGTFTSQLQQRNRGIILERNRELQRNPGAIRDCSFMGLEYDIPVADYHTITKAIRRANPGCGSRDMSMLLRGWLEKYGQPYKVR